MGNLFRRPAVPLAVGYQPPANARPEQGKNGVPLLPFRDEVKVECGLFDIGLRYHGNTNTDPIKMFTMQARKEDTIRDLKQRLGKLRGMHRLHCLRRPEQD